LSTLARGLAPALLLAITAGACSSSSNPNKPASKPVLDVAVGQCMLVPEDIKPDVSKLPIISCAKAHTHEIFFIYTDSADDVYPGVDALVIIAKRECYKHFEDYVKVSPFDSSLQVTWIVPSLDGWNGSKHDKDILCVNRRNDGGQLIGTTKGSKL